MIDSKLRSQSQYGNPRPHEKKKPAGRRELSVEFTERVLLALERKGVEIAADGKGWRKQLESMKSEFCTRINQAWGGRLVREIKFVSKPGPRRVPRELDNEHTPFVRKRRGHNSGCDTYCV